jgi:tetratricopeptide (TPR) repeat protein
MQNRAETWRRKKNYDKAIVDFGYSIELNPNLFEAFAGRGAAMQALGNYSEALADFRQAIRLAPNNPTPYNALAWLLATCPASEYRDGREAVKYALQGCDLSNWKDWMIVDTLAAAYAEDGDFDKAVQYGKRTLELCPENERAECRKQLALFEVGQPFHEAMPGAE